MEIVVKRSCSAATFVRVILFLSYQRYVELLACCVFSLLRYLTVAAEVEEPLSTALCIQAIVIKKKYPSATTASLSHTVVTSTADLFRLYKKRI